MDVERDAQIDQFSRSEPRVDSQSTAPGNSNDPAIEPDGDVYKNLSLGSKALARLKSAQEMTGFRSYVEYLKFHEECYPSLDAELWLPGIHEHGSDLGWPLTMTSMTEEGGVLNHDDQNIIEALCDPPRDTSLQIILFDVGRVRNNLIRRLKDVLDYLGLVFQLDPRFFRSMDDLNSYQSYRLSCYHPSYVTVGHAVATVCHSRLRGGSLPDVIFLARGIGFLSKYPDFSIGNIRSEEIDHIRRCPKFKRQITFKDPIRDDYIRQISELLAENNEFKDNSTTVSLLCSLSIFRLELLKLRFVCFEVGELLQHPSFESERAYNVCRELRNSINKLLNDWQSLETYTDSSQLIQCKKGYIYRQIEAEFKEVTANGDRLENSLRDRLQLEVGKLGLEESRKSIDLSNRQIEEGKRVKIFTILAFIYVPLNLATSIFGMNIQQLNESGKSLRVFLLTAIVTLAATGSSWLLIELLNGYQNWQRERTKLSPNITTSSYSMGERVAMVVWLFRHHHTSWMREVGAWWRIIINDRTRHIPSVFMNGPLMSFGEYVSKYSRPVEKNTASPWELKRAFDLAHTRLRMNLKRRNGL